MLRPYQWDYGFDNWDHITLNRSESETCCYKCEPLKNVLVAAKKATKDYEAMHAL